MIPSLPITMNEDGGPYDGPFSTFPEWHAATIGAGLGVLLALALHVAAVPIVVVAPIVARVVIYAHTGRRLEIAGRTVDLPTRYLKQIRAEPHYLDGALAIVVAASYAPEVLAV